MGKTTGFLEYTRELPRKEDAGSRISHYREFVQGYTEDKLNQQASRCMNCGIPFCHHGCPLGNIIPEFNDAVYRKSWKEAYEILSATNNFPEFTGRICPAPCESACVLGINQPPVAIEEIEKHIIETAFANGYVQPIKPAVRSGKKVAVIGSGPAGLAAAAELNSSGHLVTIFERDEQPGGLLRYGIPDFKLEKRIVERRIELMKEEGIGFRCSVEIGTDIGVNDLLREYDAIVLCGGSTIPRDLSIPGRDGHGIYFAMDFLKNQNRIIANEINGDDALNARNKNVIVIGGGDTGSDCVGTSNRQGARSVTQFELLPRPPESRNQFMPWPKFPMIFKSTSSHEEGCERSWSILTKKFIVDDHNRVRGLLISDIEWSFSQGSATGFKEIPGTERIIDCDLVLLAMGFLHPQKTGMLDQLGIELDSRGNVQALNYQTNIPRVFAAGDMRKGQSLVVWAIAEGRDCARAVCSWLEQVQTH